MWSSDPPKRRFNRPHLHGATPHKTAFFIVTAVKTSNPTYEILVLNEGPFPSSPQARRWVPGSFPENKQRELDAGQSALSTFEVCKMWGFTTMSAVCLHGRLSHKGNISLVQIIPCKADHTIGILLYFRSYKLDSLFFVLHHVEQCSKCKFYVFYITYEFL
jgi:hypothetical protein